MSTEYTSIISIENGSICTRKRNKRQKAGKKFEVILIAARTDTHDRKIFRSIHAVIDLLTCNSCLPPYVSNFIVFFLLFFLFHSFLEGIASVLQVAANRATAHQKKRCKKKASRRWEKKYSSASVGYTGDRSGKRIDKSEKYGRVHHGRQPESQMELNNNNRNIWIPDIGLILYARPNSAAARNVNKFLCK